MTAAFAVKVAAGKVGRCPGVVRQRHGLIRAGVERIARTGESCRAARVILHKNTGAGIGDRTRQSDRTASAVLHNDRVGRRVRDVAAVTDRRIAAIDYERVACRAADAAAGHGDGAGGVREIDSGGAGIGLHDAVHRETGDAAPEDLVVASVDVDILHCVATREGEHVDGRVRRQGCRR